MSGGSYDYLFARVADSWRSDTFVVTVRRLGEFEEP
jgi:hypothetical protein